MGQIETCDDLIEQIEALGIEETVKAYRKPPLHTRILRDLYSSTSMCPNTSNSSRTTADSIRPRRAHRTGERPGANRSHTA